MSCSNVATLIQPISPKLHYLLTGTFNTVFLYLLAFNPVTSSLSIIEKVKGEGPHQFFGLNQNRDKVYATTWGSPASLSAWNIVAGGQGGIEKINTVPITATSSYLHLSPKFPVIYSAGGPTGEVHAIDTVTGGFGQKLQEMVYMDKADLAKADKTRVALRYGSHGIDLSVKNQAFVPHLGLNAIVMYDVNADGTLEMTGEQKSFGEGEPDGPRHVVPSPDGNTLYVVTEHSSYLDVYTILPSSLIHRQRLSVIPPEVDAERLAYRGDTLRLSQSGLYLYVTTRGKTSATKGYVSTWSVNSDGSLGSEELSTVNDPTPPIERYQTRNSGGKANAIEAFPFHVVSKEAVEGEAVKDWIVLTDDEEGWIWMLEWNGKNMVEIASVKLGEGEEDESGFVGASHAVWLS